MTNPLIFLNHQAAQPASVPALPRSGDGTRLTINALGHSVGASPRGQTFNHPFRPLLGSMALTFRLGTVQSMGGLGPIEPKIKVNGQLVPMSGKDGSTPAALSLRGVEPNADGLSWAAIEVTPDAATGDLTKDSRVEIVHTVEPINHAPNLGRKAIALIVWSGGNPLRVYPMVHFNLQYLRILASVGNPTGAPKHWFL